MGWQGCKGICAKPSLPLCSVKKHKSWVSSVVDLLWPGKWIRPLINILYKQPRFCSVLVIINQSWYCSWRCFVSSHACSILLWRTEGQLEQTTWSARVHKEISEDYFCNFRVNALFIILWIAEAKSGKDLRSLAEIQLALRWGGKLGGGEEKMMRQRRFSLSYLNISMCRMCLSSSSGVSSRSHSVYIRLPTIISHWRAFLSSLCVNYHLAALHALHDSRKKLYALRGSFLQMWLPFQ